MLFYQPWIWIFFCWQWLLLRETPLYTQKRSCKWNPKGATVFYKVWCQMVYVFILLCNVIRTEKKRQMEYKFKSPFSEHKNCAKTGISFALSPKSHTEYFSVACCEWTACAFLSIFIKLILLLHSRLICDLVSICSSETFAVEHLFFG